MSKWTWLIDDYERGTAFITDDPADKQEAIAYGMAPGEAQRIVDAHNKALADLEALREVTEQLVVAEAPYLREFLAKKAETILRRLREDKPATTLRDIEEGRAVQL